LIELGSLYVTYVNLPEGSQCKFILIYFSLTVKSHLNQFLEPTSTGQNFCTKKITL